MNILVTGGAGFIGSHVVDALLTQGHTVVVVDEFNAAYPVEFKKHNIQHWNSAVEVVTADIAQPEVMEHLVRLYRPQQIIHLAARAGVRTSHLNPQAYIHSNINGTANVFLAAQRFGVQRVIAASSSSVYGHSPAPFTEDRPLPQPLSLYAATKQSGELLAHHFLNQGLPITIFRFFTVYGERGRPDMAPYLFAKALFQRQPITVFGDGQQLRDFTYIADIVSGILKAVQAPTHFPVMNLGHNQPIPLIDFIHLMERLSGQSAQIQIVPAKPEEMPITWANIFRAKQYLKWVPTTSLETGLTRFLDWFQRQHL